LAERHFIRENVGEVCRGAGFQQHVSSDMNARRLAAFALTTGLLVLAAADAAPAAGPLMAFAGNWSGSGTITVENGSRERLRCRSTNRADNSSLSLILRCASDSYKFEFASDVTSDGSNISGSWNENTRGVFGQLAGKVGGGRIQAMASAVGVTASVSVTAQANGLSVLIRSPGSDFSEVSITMVKAAR
jgi:hypothetical protein